MRDLFPYNASGHFAPSAMVVIFCSFGASVASLFHTMRDLLPAAASGRFAPSPMVVIFHFFGTSVASLPRLLLFEAEKTSVVPPEKVLTR